VSSHCVQIANRLGVTARAEVAALAGEREQVLVRAVVAADAREPVIEHAAREELVGDLLLFPGRDVGGDGIVLELHGFVIDLMGPDTTQALPASAALKVRARVRMLCSCPTQPGGMWEVRDVVARLIRDKVVVREATLTYGGEPSIYTGELSPVEPGVYQLEVLAANPAAATFGVVRRRVTITR